MQILSNKEILINEFNKIYEEINSFDISSNNIGNITKNIRTKMLDFGKKIFEDWFYKEIGTGQDRYKKIYDNNGTREILKFHNNLEKTYLTCLGEVTLKRAYYRNENMGYFPIEDQYTWLKDDFFPDIKELSCYISMLEPYDTASEMLAKIGGIKISSSSLQKITKIIGNKLVEIEDTSIENNTVNNVKEKPELLIISSDGSCINTKEQWKEVKSGAVYQVKRNTKNELTAINKSYISRIENSQDFGKRLFLEARRRNVHFANQVVTIGDGAKWIWEMFGKYYPQSIEIVDWYHASEHLWKIIELLYGNRDNDNGKEFEKKCEELLYNGLIYLLKDSVINKMKELHISEESNRGKSIETEINYFMNNKERMKYSVFEEMGFPIGSGVIEGACKQLVQIRMKRNGMKWSINGAHDVLQLRCLYYSDRWNEVENVINDIAA